MIHPTAIISPEAKIGSGVSIDAYTIIYANVEIGDNSKIGAFCEIGFPAPQSSCRPLIIGQGALIRSHSVFYEDSTFGDDLVTGHRVTVREGTRAGRNLQIGTLGDIQGACQLGDYIRFHSNVHIGKHSKVGNFVWIFPYVVLTNDPHPPSEVMQGVTLQDYVALATMSVVLPGVVVGRGALVGAHSLVARDVEPDTLVAGSPAKKICSTEKILLKDGTGRSAYPWRRHFGRGYPDEIVEHWLKEFGDDLSITKTIA